MQNNTLVISSHAPGWLELANVTCKSHYDWCQKHRYEYYLDCSELYDNYWNPVTKVRERLPIKGFIKLDLFLHFLPKYKRVIWLDADLLVTNPEYSADHFMNQRPHSAIVLPYDWNGHNSTVIMAESFDRVWDYFWSCNNTGRKLFLNHDWVEMEAMRYFAMTPPYNDDFIGYLHAKQLCALRWEEYVDAGVPERVSKKYGWEQGDFALHLSALPLDRRVELAKDYSRLVAGVYL